VSTKCIVDPHSGRELTDAQRTKDNCNKCGERTELVFAGFVCSNCSSALDKQWTSATAKDWILITTPLPDDEVYSAMRALKDSLDLMKGGLPTGSENRGAPELVLVRYIYQNLTYAEMKLRWAMADKRNSHTLGLLAPHETDQMKSELGTRKRLAYSFLRPASVEEIAETRVEIASAKMFYRDNGSAKTMELQ